MPRLAPRIHFPLQLVSLSFSWLFFWLFSGIVSIWLTFMIQTPLSAQWMIRAIRRGLSLTLIPTLILNPTLALTLTKIGSLSLRTFLRWISFLAQPVSPDIRGTSSGTTMAILERSAVSPAQLTGSNATDPERYPRPMRMMLRWSVTPVLSMISVNPCYC